jgi:hypothetical protein
MVISPPANPSQEDTNVLTTGFNASSILYSIKRFLFIKYL